MAIPWPQVVLFGDSLFQGAPNIAGSDTTSTPEDGKGYSFQADLQAHVIRRYDVVNRGLSGYNTSQALKLLPQIFAPPAPGGPTIKFLFILLGANDACVPWPGNDQHVPLDQYTANLTKIITDPLITAHNPKIYLVTPPPVDEIRITELDLAWGWPEATRQAKASAAYSDAVRKIAAAHPDVGLVDLWKAVMDRAVQETPGFELKGPDGPFLGDPECGERGFLPNLLPDGLHLSGLGYMIFCELVKPLVDGEWRDAPEDDRVGYVLPDWKTAPKLED